MQILKKCKKDINIYPASGQPREVQQGQKILEHPGMSSPSSRTEGIQQTRVSPDGQLGLYQQINLYTEIIRKTLNIWPSSLEYPVWQRYITSVVTQDTDRLPYVGRLGCLILEAQRAHNRLNFPSQLTHCYSSGRKHPGCSSENITVTLNTYLHLMF